MTTEPATYRKKPVEIQAMRWTGDNAAELEQWTGGHFRTDPRLGHPEAEIWDELHASWINVLRDQWVIRGVKGEFYPCAEDVFEQTYDEVPADAPSRPVAAVPVPVQGADPTGPQEAHSGDEDDCPHCSPRHGNPATRNWGVRVADERDGDGQPTHLRVEITDGSHVAPADARWLWELIRSTQDPAGPQTDTDGDEEPHPWADLDQAAREAEANCPTCSRDKTEAELLGEIRQLRAALSAWRQLGEDDEATNAEKFRELEAERDDARYAAKQARAGLTAERERADKAEAKLAATVAELHRPVGMRPDGTADPRVEAGADALIAKGISSHTAWEYSDTVLRAVFADLRASATDADGGEGRPLRTVRDRKGLLWFEVTTDGYFARADSRDDAKRRTLQTGGGWLMQEKNIDGPLTDVTEPAEAVAHAFVAELRAGTEEAQS